MPDLIATGSIPAERWRRPLPLNVPFTLGRTAEPWATPWDERVSRRHAQLCWNGQRLQVSSLAEARNPIYYRGRKATIIELKPGEHFVIGGTTFSLTAEQAAASLQWPLPQGERTFSPAELARVAYRQADQRLDALARLPEMIANSTDDAELSIRLVSLLLSGIPQATAAAVVLVEPSPQLAAGLTTTGSPAETSILHWDRPFIGGGDFHPSQRLIRQAIDGGESVVHVWNAASATALHSATFHEVADWAFCTPIAGGRKLALYVTGKFAEPTSNPHAPTLNGPNPDSLQEEVKFAQLVATTTGSLLEARRLTQQQASLAHFFSPIVLQALAGKDYQQVLAPREADVTVLFCDLRGFSRQSEQMSSDLLGLLDRVSSALGIMTQHILAQGGVVGDFHGDSAMGFWGWPLPQADRQIRACRAALAIEQEFAGSELARFRAGIGIASGRAVAGKIGSLDQVKVTAFGPVVNLAARLESITKLWKVPILIDGATAAAVCQELLPTEAEARSLARVRPAGLQTIVEVFQLCSASVAAPSAAESVALAAASEAFQAGDWPLARQLWEQLSPTQPARQIHLDFLATQPDQPPANWDGAIPVEK